MNPHLVLVDGLNLIRRMYEANPAPDTPEKAHRALYIADNHLRSLKDKLTPTHWVLVLDPPGKNWRHALYPAYKAHRSPMPSPLAQALAEYAQHPGRAIKASLSVPGQEADDVIASLTKKALDWGFQVTISSTDKDLWSLIQGDQVRVYNAFDQRIVCEKACFEKFGVTPRQLLDLLALTGDTADGVPGVPRIGVKTAAKLLTEYETLEATLTHASSIPGQAGRMLTEHATIARLSRQLVSLNEQAMRSVDWDTLLAI